MRLVNAYMSNNVYAFIFLRIGIGRPKGKGGDEPTAFALIINDTVKFRCWILKFVAFLMVFAHWVGNFPEIRIWSWESRIPTGR